jgi:predicted house-cleaning noncanonical NTP pyrophosphatase (MazG superfamily)
MSGYLVKLVRDRTEESFEHDSHDIAFSPLGRTTHVRALRRKLAEEVGEYLVDPSIDELVDILEVCDALAALDLGVRPRELDARKRAKIAERGGFMEGMGMFAREADHA